MQCAFCGKLLESRSAWKGASDAFYCNEFCADSEAPEPISQPTSLLLQQHVNRRYERLQQLLPHMRSYSGQALPAARR
jgi:hypothetical protein